MSERSEAALLACCEHPPSEHDQHGCTVDVSTNRRCYERCHGLPTAPVARPVLVAMVALQEANRFPATLPGDPTNSWGETVREITQRDAEAVVSALTEAGLLIDADSIPVADAYSREDFGEAEAFGWNACRDYLLTQGASDA